ncbi:ATP synthase subunit I [Nitrosomonas sp.]|uniref:ATP synthase subunit I n=1 Tax=Nitrosomonas sp. TaxID=42353 RepID=UPI001E026ACA|nr:ATP synthase subunit I [Nitrosomonas sp.]MCB1948036.1 ATP synthase subunit I [Nitrosomonas sp.]MCP5243478.1 ATP synthase subunit I [Burkholderiales bacterium]MDR4513509.1 ATP synthase subunit I [Nitrosomonas sp.]
MASWITLKPLVIVLRWQLLITIVVTGALALLMDSQYAVSAFLGGMVSIISSTAFAIIVSRHKGYTAGGTIRTALRAEAVKIILTIGLLWIVFKTYDDLKAFAFIGTFILTVITHSLALFVSDDKNTNHVN